MSPQEGPARFYWLVGTAAAVAIVLLLAFAALLMKLRATLPDGATLARLVQRSSATQRQATCLANVKSISLSLLMYAQDWDQTLPPAEGWTLLLDPYVHNRQILRCPSDDSNAPCSYGFNEALAGRSIAHLANAQDVVLVFETAHPGVAPVGGPADVASPPRHRGSNCYGYADGHARESAGLPSFTPVFARPAPGGQTL